VGQQKAARAVGDLGQARRVAALTEQRRLLVAAQGGDGQRLAEKRSLGLADHPARVDELGQHRAGHAEQRQQLLVPGAGVDVVEQRARGVGRVGHMQPTAAQVPDEPGVDRAEGELAAAGARDAVVDVPQDPAQLGRREVGIEHEPGPLAHERLVAGHAQLATLVGRAAILPDDGRRDRQAAGPFPDDGGLTLVGDSDRRHLRGAVGTTLQRLPGRVALRRPDLERVLLDPARLRVGMADLTLG
jgi:hypothetical protein